MKKILIAEDNPASSELMIEVLSGRGYEIIEVVRWTASPGEDRRNRA